MNNRCRKGRRSRDEKRTLEVRMSIEISNPRIFKKYEKPLVFLYENEIRPFPFEGPAQTKTLKTRCQKSLTKHVFSSKTVKHSFKNPS